MSSRIERRNNFAGRGMMNTPEHLEELENRRLQHERITRGKPEKPFSQVLHEKMHGKPEPREEEELPERGAKDPHLGLSPGQSPELAEGGRGRRAGRVIVKG